VSSFKGELEVTSRYQAAVVRGGARRRLIKWKLIVFHFRRRRPKSLDLVLLGSRGQQTQLHIRQASLS